MVRRGIVIPDYEEVANEPSGEVPGEAATPGEGQPPERKPPAGGEAPEKQTLPDKVLAPAAEP